jgi:hypothetical protein
MTTLSQFDKEVAMTKWLDWLIHLCLWVFMGGFAYAQIIDTKEKVENREAIIATVPLLQQDMQYIRKQVNEQSLITEENRRELQKISTDIAVIKNILQRGNTQ